MANTIRIKRRAAGGAAGAPASLANAELAFNEQDNVLYYGKGTGGVGGSATTVEVVGGLGAFVTLTTDQTVTGNKTFSAAPIVPTQITSDNSTKAASTAYVKSVLPTVSAGTGITVATSGTVPNSAVSITNTAVTAGSYGSSTAIPTFTVNAQGQLTAAGSVGITVGDGALTLGIGTAAATATTVTIGTGTGFTANDSTAITYDIKVGPALTALATLMTTAGAGFIKRGATADTYTIDTTAYTTNLGTVTAVTATAPVASSGGTTPVISMAAATTSVSGYLTSTDWTTFNSKQASGTYATGTGSASGTNTGDNAVNTLYSALVTNATHTGDATGATALTLATVNSNIGTFNNVTINAKGLATAGSNVAYLTALTDTLATVTARGATTAVASTFSGGIAMGNTKITGLATPTADTDAVNKLYVDAMSQGLSVKDAVRAATTANITLSAPQTVDGVVLVAGNRVLVKNQTTGAENGLYLVAAAAWTRTVDADAPNEMAGGDFVFVQEGTTQADSGWVCTNDGAVTIGTTALTFAQFSGAGQVLAGAGLTKTGNTIDVIGTSNRILVNADSIDIASTYVGQTSITTLGTIATGVWNGTGLTVPYGGTGVATIASNGVVYGNGTAAIGNTGAGTWDATNLIGTILSVNSSGVPTWTNEISGGTF